ncbi:mitochondrial fission factor homolog B isoform X1 [Esox lucius]|uniref:mitochondrial fission factor homolog B isoform X1 n=1 Tax=Esox lucius TaxID=8010 RepID=UPI0005769D9F|nr:mitochondrial fission factor homolog B isoform X1 [Esox lucius]XP_028978526.1 mitochondrial fission factor homolog B isoform X1 [Esox lucius]XP_034150609.1 mitochondrial fission factor homolog B isoform X1 [Esox lucius]
MNGAAFPSPTAEMAEMNRIHYELEYTEGISQRMRIPEMLKMGPYSQDNPEAGSHDFHNIMMQVPERIVMSGDSEDSQFSRPRDLDLIQSTPLESLSLKTPPRVLTLNERPLDFMEMERSAAPAQPIEEVRSQTRLRRERSASENATVRQNSQMARNDSTVNPPPPAPVLSCPPLTMAEDGQNLYSASGVLSFIQSTTRRAYQQVLEVLDENHRSKPSLRGGSASTSNPLHESRFALATLDSTLDVSMAPDDMAVVDAATLRRQIIKLNRRLQLIEEENKERAKREVIMYSLTVAFWLINSWVWFRR